MKLKVFINGKILPEDKACVSVFDRGLSYGDGIYETMKARDGQPLFLNEHLKRLRAGGRFLGITGIKGFEEMIRGGALQKLLNANGLGRGEAYVTLLVTSGPARGKITQLPAQRTRKDEGKQARSVRSNIRKGRACIRGQLFKRLYRKR